MMIPKYQLYKSEGESTAGRLSITGGMQPMSRGMKRWGPFKWCIRRLPLTKSQRERFYLIMQRPSTFASTRPSEKRAVPIAELEESCFAAGSDINPVCTRWQVVCPYVDTCGLIPRAVCLDIDEVAVSRCAHLLAA